MQTILQIDSTGFLIACAGAEPGDREALGAPVDGALFFAGEAAHPAVNPCMQVNSVAVL